MSSKEHLPTLVIDVDPSSSEHKLNTAMYFHLKPQISVDFFHKFSVDLKIQYNPINFLRMT